MTATKRGAKPGHPYFGGKWPQGGPPRTAASWRRHPDWFTTKEAASYLQCSVSKILAGRSDGSLRAVKKTWQRGPYWYHAYFFAKGDLDKWNISNHFKSASGELLPLLGRLPLDIRKLNPLRKWRKNQGLTASEVSIKLLVSEGKMASWEHGGANPRGHEMERIAALIGVEVAEIQLQWAAWRVMASNPPVHKRVEINRSFPASRASGADRQVETQKSIPDEAA